MASSAAEIKTEGAVEMANDPNSTVSSDDAQRKMVEESQKAGVPAFTFNPDASPEEKAAQAKAVSCPIAAAPRLIALTDILAASACWISP